MSMPRAILHLEGAAVLALSLFFYFQLGGAWQLFVVLLLAPDLGMLGYLGDARLGSITYNALHLYVWPLALIVVAYLSSNLWWAQLALIWAAHIGMDRMLGYGLKYPTVFKDTHLQRL